MTVVRVITTVFDETLNNVQPGMMDLLTFSHTLETGGKLSYFSAKLALSG